MKLTPKEAAKQAQVSQSTIYGLLKLGRIPATRIGARGKGRWLIEQDALDAFVKRCKVAVPAMGR